MSKNIVNIANNENIKKIEAGDFRKSGAGAFEDMVDSYEKKDGFNISDMAYYVLSYIRDAITNEIENGYKKTNVEQLKEVINEIRKTTNKSKRKKKEFKLKFVKSQ